MKYICQNYHKSKNKILKLYNYTNIKFIMDIKYLFPDIKIEFNVKSFINFDSIRFFLDEISLINVYEKTTHSKIDIFLRSITLLNKPELKLLSETNLDKNLIIENKIHTVDYSMIINKNNNVLNTKTQPIVKVQIRYNTIDKQEEPHCIKSNKKLSTNINIVKNFTIPIQNQELIKLEDVQIKSPIQKSNGIFKISPKKEEVHTIQTIKQIKIKKI